jgi:hypothetical protein
MISFCFFDSPHISGGEKEAGWEIVSFIEKEKEQLTVKRKSDGEVFTVGDEVEYRCGGDNDWENVYGYGKINSFRLASSAKDKIEIEIDDDHRWDDNYYPHKYIENIRHKQKEERKPLFVTEDGKEMFKGESFWWLYKPDMSINRGVACDGMDGKEKYSTEDAVMCSIPCLSAKDSWDYFKIFVHPGDKGKVFDEFIALAKSKL